MTVVISPWDWCSTLFSYLGSEQMFTGVMAQDALGVMPDAVSRNAAGFYRVNYRMLGIEMRPVA